MSSIPSKLDEFASLVEIIRALRAPGGCPWDRKQTNKTLTRYAIEEAHELVEAIESGDDSDVKDELGDVLLQVVLHSQIYTEAKSFNIYDVIENLSQKMIRRHPHVFNKKDEKEVSAEQVSESWQEIKESEGKKRNRLDIPNGLPALQAADKIGRKTKDVFDWPSAEAVLEKVREELDETLQAIQSESTDRVGEELGDLMFSVAQWARHLGHEPEQLLRATNRKFMDRFNRLNELIESDGKNLNELGDDEKERYWERVKNQP